MDHLGFYAVAVHYCGYPVGLSDTLTINWLQLAAGFLFAVIISLAAYRLGSLNRSGAAAATLLGTAIFGLGGLAWAVLLLGFFISSSLLSRLFKRRKTTADEKFSKGSRRDAGQVLANGGITGFFVVVQVFFPESVWPWVGAAAALAAANADTWATELGILSPTEPRLITTGIQVEMGTSGGVTVLGTLAAAGGALFIALLALVAWPETGAASSPVTMPARLALITLAGVAGSLVDSFIGATIQAIYRCPVCDKETERHPLHTCGTPTVMLRGLKWLNNDWVNAACTISAALLAIAIILFAPSLSG
jgi:uncharacterized protein (TIGR00297 family)